MNDKTERGKIFNLKKYKQAKLISFVELQYERKITPTDVDFVIDFGNEEWVIGEFKTKGTSLPYGQKLCLERLCQNLTLKTKKVLGFIAIFSTPTNEIINASTCIVSEIWINNKWEFSRKRTVKNLIDEWRKFNQQTKSY